MLVAAVQGSGRRLFLNCALHAHDSDIVAQRRIKGIIPGKQGLHTAFQHPF